jgi:hypothetical protein
MAAQRYTFKNQTFKRFYDSEPRTGTVVLDIDWQEIVDALGTKAAWNKSGKSKLALGIKAKFIGDKK